MSETVNYIVLAVAIALPVFAIRFALVWFDLHLRILKISGRIIVFRQPIVAMAFMLPMAAMHLALGYFVLTSDGAWTGLYLVGGVLLICVGLSALLVALLRGLDFTILYPSQNLVVQRSSAFFKTERLQLSAWQLQSRTQGRVEVIFLENTPIEIILTYTYSVNSRDAFIRELNAGIY
jgi:hypothetical protein